jgi:hypothetical protein
MSGRSSTRSARVGLAGAALLLGACGKAAPPPAPEADPAQVTQLANAMLANAPTMGAVPPCKDGELRGGASLTHNTLLRLGGKTLAADPEHADWINPPELDAPAFHTLIEGGASTAARQAAAAVLAAPFYVVYRLDNVDAPLALGVKELKIGTIGARAIRYDRRGLPTCVVVFFFQNDKELSKKAIAESDKTLVDPAVVMALRADLRAQYLASVPR